jgi:dynein light chain roadblock-type
MTDRTNVSAASCGAIEITLTMRQQANGQDALDEKLDRLSKKQGVKATIVLDRATGAILRTTGQLSSLSSATSALSGRPRNLSFSGDPAGAQNGEARGLEEVAAKVWTWIQASGALVEELDAEVGSRTKCTRHDPRTQLTRWTMTGRAEVTTATDEEAGAGDCARHQIPPHRGPRYAAGLKHNKYILHCTTLTTPSAGTLQVASSNSITTTTWRLGRRCSRGLQRFEKTRGSRGLPGDE